MAAMSAGDDAAKERLYGRFWGDGRQQVEALPADICPRSNPLAVTKSGARRLIDTFQSSGMSNHSAQGGTLWVILEHCRTHFMRHELREYRDDGATIGWLVMKERGD